MKMKKVILMILGVMMIMSLVGCGKDKGYTPEQIIPTENVSTNETEESNTEIVEEIDVDNLQKYYDTEHYIGTPRLSKVDFCGNYGDGTICATENVSEGEFKAVFRVKNTQNIPNGTKLWCIICDNGTIDDVTDDTLAYIFTTPIK
jgi:predicted small lipoprotein YifL